MFYKSHKICLFYFFFLFFLLNACNSVFYYPDSRNYLSPKNLELDFEDLRIPSANGNSLHVWHIKAHGPRKGVVVHFHGNAQNMSAHLGFSYWLPDKGFDLITFDYQGYGKSEGFASRQNTIEDGQSVLRYVSRKLPTSDLFVLGQSLGGAIAFTTVAKTPDAKVRALALESTFSSYREMARAKLKQIKILSLFRLPLSYLVSDFESPKNYLEQMSVPVLIVHGTADEVVPFEEGEKLFDRVRPRKQFFPIDNAGHTPAFGYENSPFHNLLADFFCEHMSDKDVCSK